MPKLYADDDGTSKQKGILGLIIGMKGRPWLDHWAARGLQPPCHVMERGAREVRERWGNRLLVCSWLDNNPFHLYRVPLSFLLSLSLCLSLSLSACVAPCASLSLSPPHKYKAGYSGGCRKKHHSISASPKQFYSVEALGFMSLRVPRGVGRGGAHATTWSGVGRGAVRYNQARKSHGQSDQIKRIFSR